MTKAPGDGWAFLPEDGRPDRLIRFVRSGVFVNNMLAATAPEFNVVLIDKGLFDALDNIDQGRVLATHEDLYATVRDGKVSIFNR